MPSLRGLPSVFRQLPLRRKSSPNQRNLRQFEALETRLALSAHSIFDIGNVENPPDSETFQASLGRIARSLTAGETFATALQLGDLSAKNAKIWGYMSENEIRDVYRFSVDSDAKVDIRLSNTRSDLDLYLFDDQGQLLDRSYNPGTWNESLSSDVSAGDYFVAVRRYAGNSTHYKLRIRPELKPSPPLETSPPNETPMDTPPVQTPPTGTPPPATSPPTSETPVETPTNPPATPDTVIEQPTAPVSFPDVEYYGGFRDWNLNSIMAPEVWSAGYTGEGITVAVIDTGVDYSHRELAGNIWSNIDETPGNGIDDDRNGFVDDTLGWDFVNNDAYPMDSSGHGTHVAGTIAAAKNGSGATGVAYDTTIMPIRVLGGNGTGTIYDVAAGVRYAVDNGADVINLSLGGGGYSSSMKSALQYAERNGVFVVAAAGNSYGGRPDYPARYSASLSNVISVGAYSNSGQKAGFSNGVGNSGAVQVDAPGVSVFSTLPNNGHASWSGTSMAAPHVAGLAALTLSSNPSLTPAALRDLIVDHADKAIANSESVGVNAATTVAAAASYDGGLTTTQNVQASTTAVTLSRFRFSFIPSRVYALAGHAGAVASAESFEPAYFDSSDQVLSENLEASKLNRHLDFALQGANWKTRRWSYSDRAAVVEFSHETASSHESETVVDRAILEDWHRLV